MLLEIRKSWWRNRWHVYRLGHLDGDGEWLASFRVEKHARGYANRMAGLR